MYTHICRHGAPEPPRNLGQALCGPAPSRPPETWGRLFEAQLPPDHLEVGVELPPGLIEEKEFGVSSVETAPGRHSRP